MEISQVPQEGNKTLAGNRKVVYAKDANGHFVKVASNGWEVEEIVTSHALETLNELAQSARVQVVAGTASSLAFWMYARRMDVPLLAQSSGFWQWQVRRHLQPKIFVKISQRQLMRYAEALGITVEQLKTLP